MRRLCLIVLPLCGCATLQSPAEPIPAALEPPPDRNPPIRTADAVEPAGGGPARAAGTDPEPHLRALIDDRPAVYDRLTGHWVVREPVSTSPRLVYTLSAAAGDLRRLIIVLGEYRPGRGEPPIDPATEVRILALTDLPAAVPFRLDEPGSGVRIRLPGGETAERIKLRPNTEYVAWMQITTTGRLRDGNPWPWPYLRFRTAR
jgi:hypothetical protein